MYENFKQLAKILVFTVCPVIVMTGVVHLAVWMGPFSKLN